MTEDFTQLYVQITQDCIDVGERGNCYFCPVAVAVRRAIGRTRHFRNVCVLDGRVLIDGRPYALPARVRAFVRRFDERGLLPFAESISPMDFSIWVEPKVLAEPVEVAAERLIESTW